MRGGKLFPPWQAGSKGREKKPGIRCTFQEHIPLPPPSSATPHFPPSSHHFPNKSHQINPAVDEFRFLMVQPFSKSSSSHIQACNSQTFKGYSRLTSLYSALTLKNSCLVHKPLVHPKGLKRTRISTKSKFKDFSETKSIA